MNTANSNPGKWRTIEHNGAPRVWPVWLLSCTLVTLASGCHDSGIPGPTGRVSGQVTSHGQPVTQGMVTFRNEQQGIIAGMHLAADGKYVLRFAGGMDIPVGDYEVSIAPPEKDLPLAAEGGVHLAPTPVDEFPEIPPRYRNASTSGLKATVVEGANAFDFELNP